MMWQILNIDVVKPVPEIVHYCEMCVANSKIVTQKKVYYFYELPYQIRDLVSVEVQAYGISKRQEKLFIRKQRIVWKIHRQFCSNTQRNAFRMIK